MSKEQLLTYIAYPFVVGVAVYIVTAFLAKLWPFKTEPPTAKPELEIIDYKSKAVGVPRKNDKEATLEYAIHFKLHNKGTQPTTLLSCEVDVNNGWWVATHEPFKDERSIPRGHVQLIQLFANLAKNAEKKVVPTDSLPDEVNCKLSIFYAGSKVPLVDNIVLEVKK